MTRTSSNKLEDSRRLASCYTSNSNDNNSLKHYVNSGCDVIHLECNKPLQSKFYVESNSKTRFEWRYNSDRHYGVYRAVGNLWLCRDRKQTTLSDCEREQIKLYNRLKREYEREQKLLNSNNTVDESVVTIEEKQRAKTVKRSMQLMDGLACAPNYKLLYAV